MKLILAHYLRTLRERDEFDRLLPELVIEMGYVPLGKPQTGVRQYGVDFAAVGQSLEDGVREILLFVIKQGDIGRNDWHGDPRTSVHPTLIEVLEVYLTTHLAPEHQQLRKVVIVATTGDLKQELHLNWKGFVESNHARAKFEFWSGDHVASLLERHLLDEHLFAESDRTDLRKALALAGDRDYDFRDLQKVLRRQLGLNNDGTVSEPSSNIRQLTKAIYRANLAAQVCAHWAQSDGDRKQALWVAERTLLWTWHRIQFTDPASRKELYKALGDPWASYSNAAKEYVEAIQLHASVRDGMAGYCRENVEFSLVLFEHIGLLATIGLSQVLTPVEGDAAKEIQQNNVEIVGQTLLNIINNNNATSSPRLDRNVCELCLALIFLISIGRDAEAELWLTEIAHRLHFSFITKRSFPIGTDSLDDLVEFEVSPNEEMAKKMMSTSWMLATVASWCAIGHLEEPYSLLTNGYEKAYSEICPQLWHPTEDWPKYWYYQTSYYEHGETEAPYSLPKNSDELRARVGKFNGLEKYNWAKHSQTAPIGLWPIDFIAARHFQLPVPAHFWFQIADFRSGRVQSFV
ncbi:hypothetical protein [Aquitalea pelogenes]|uniref:hypothetical protein n=1 Tax=Aquitalea pelogenes TaxID=1293573 RepID=UPI000787DCE3|nr:hypothetical protein [Aquitalea pelogenes]